MCESVLTDPRISRAATVARDIPRFHQGFIRPGLLTTLDGAEHARSRRLIAKAFTSRRIADTRPRLDEIASELVADLAAHGPPSDVLERVARPLAIGMIHDMIGILRAERSPRASSSPPGRTRQATATRCARHGRAAAATCVAWWSSAGARVERVLVEDGRAVGVELGNGERHYADHVVSACDGHTTIYRLLGGRYTSPSTDKLYRDLLTGPGNLFPAIATVFVGIDQDSDPDAAHSITHLLPPGEAAKLPGALRNSLATQARSRYSDGFAPSGKSVLRCSYLSDFEYWNDLRSADRKAYRAGKETVGRFIRDFLERRYPGIGPRIEVLDVATPVTTRRYTGNWGGSIFAWMPFSDPEDVVTKLTNADRMRLPGLRGFSMAGQWVSMGSLVRAATSGRFVTQFLCAELGLPFRAWESAGAEPWHPGKLGNLPQLDRRPVHLGADE